jgi:hypothetical protein
MYSLPQLTLVALGLLLTASGIVASEAGPELLHPPMGLSAATTATMKPRSFQDPPMKRGRAHMEAMRKRSGKRRIPVVASHLRLTETYRHCNGEVGGLH